MKLARTWLLQCSTSFSFKLKAHRSTLLAPQVQRQKKPRYMQIEECVNNTMQPPLPAAAEEVAY